MCPPPGSDPIHEAIEDFMDRYRAGETPSVEDYAARLPGREEEFREILSALAIMEEAAVDGSAVSSQLPRLTGIPTRLGEYRILREVGRGGMGVVYEAEQESLGRRVALKVLPFPTLMNDRGLERFRQEARSVAQLHHSNIVPVFGIGEEGGIHYYAMQFIDGETLDRVIGELRRLKGDGFSPSNPTRTLLSERRADQGEVTSPGISERTLAAESDGEANARSSARSDAESTSSASSLFNHPVELTREPSSDARYYNNVARVGLQVAEALAYAHEQGVLHRDIKPANLLLDAHGVIWVTDFGLAKLEDGDVLTHTGDVLGTLAYMAPERFRGWSDRRSDIYSLGVTLYELLTLRPAFRDADRGRLIRRVVHDDPPRPSRVAPNLPRDLETIVMKAIEKDERSRYQSARELGQDLGAFLDDRPITARRVSLMERSWRWCRRNAVVSLLGVVALILLTVASVSLAFMGVLHEEKDRADRARVQAEAAETDGRFWRNIFNARALTFSRQVGRVELSRSLIRAAAATLSEMGSGIESTDERWMILRNQIIRTESTHDLPIAAAYAGFGPPEQVAVSPDFRSYAVVSNTEDLIEIRRLSDRALISRLGTRGTKAGIISFSPNGRYLAAAKDGASFHLWDVKTQTEDFVSRPGARSFAVGFSPDEDVVVLGFIDKSLEIHAIPGGDTIRKLRVGDPPYTVRFDPRGGRFAVSFGTHILLFEAATGRVVGGFEHAGFVRGVDWHPRLEILAAASSDKNIYLWDTKNGREIDVLHGHGAEVLGVVFNHEGDVLASTSWDVTLRLWNPYTGKLLVTRPSRSMRHSTRFSSDDRYLAHTVEDGEARILEVVDGPAYQGLHGHSVDIKGPFSASISVDGTLGASAGPDGVRLWDLERDREIAHLPRIRGWESTCIFHSSGDALITSDGQTILQWPLVRVESRSGIRRALLTRPLRVPVSARNGIRDLASSANGKWLAFHEGTKAWAFRFDTSEERWLEGIQKNPALSSLSYDGTWFASGNWGGDGVTVWNVPEGRVAHRFDTGGSAGAFFTPEGHSLVVSDHRRLSFYDVGTWRLEHALERDSSLLLGVCGFSPDGRILAYNFSLDTVRLIDRSTGEPLADLTAPDAFGRENFTGNIVFSSDGSRLLIPTPHSVVQSWNIRHLRECFADLSTDWDPPLPPREPNPHGESGVGVLVSPCEYGDPRSDGDLARLEAEREIWDDQAEYYHELGHVLSALERKEEAARAFDRALELRPRWPLVVAHRAQLAR